MLDYTDALILLTNASSTPLGRALAHTYARHGARLILLDLSLPSSASTLANQLRAAGHSAWSFALPATPSASEHDHNNDHNHDHDHDHNPDLDPALPALALRIISNVGIPDILHCHDDFHQPDTDPLPAPATLSRAFAATVLGALRAVRAFAPAMRRRGAGWVVLTGRVGAFGLGLEAEAEVVRGVCAAGVVRLGQGVAGGLRGSGVGVTVVYAPRGVRGEEGEGGLVEGEEGGSVEEEGRPVEGETEEGGPVKEETEEGKVFAGWDLKARTKGREMSVEEAAERMVEGVRSQKFCVSADEMFETVLVHWAMNGFDPNIEYPVQC
ncbi:hypothetical protein OIDMADRAFT_80189 [Neofusicoccum parvum]|uniref:Uncharacterized protein n=1 Tax=Neofusicoccum parvum TaxID=310453 RepID=A0ACB5SMQ7_9PEZI|nr:hypothetical protein OIDMADRAFT_80189 [Neofusicoccum parvum]